MTLVEILNTNSFGKFIDYARQQNMLLPEPRMLVVFHKLRAELPVKAILKASSKSWLNQHGHTIPERKS